MKVGISNDHRGYKLKKEILEYLHEAGYSCIDYGTNDENSVDYVDYAVKLCKGILNKEIDRGILICGTGIGMSIAANKIKGIRCARVVNQKEACLAGEHNMANVIALGEDTKGADIVVSSFLNSKYSKDERHIRRINKINSIEKEGI